MLQFVHWSLAAAGGGATDVGGIRSTCRRIGQELYSPSGVVDGPGAANALVRSPDLAVRVLARLCVLQTPQQVDWLAGALDGLRQDLLDIEGKRLFHRYRGLRAILPALRMHIKGLVKPASDVLLTVMMGSEFLHEFVRQLLTPAWFDWLAEAFHPVASGPTPEGEMSHTVIFEHAHRRSLIYSE